MIGNLNYYLWDFQTLLTIAENLLREPGNPKYQQFKPTNGVIQRELMNPRGAIEYAIEVGYSWRQPHTIDLTDENVLLQ